ncbi:unnamed protein product, partial [Durusdinium trenchii]
MSDAVLLSDAGKARVGLDLREGLFTQHRAKFKNDELRIWVRFAPLPDMIDISFMEIYNEQIRDLLEPLIGSIGPKPTTGNKKDDRKACVGLPACMLALHGHESLSSRVNLVDLAGSERRAASASSRLVIKQLAEIQQEPINRFMVGAVSPASICADETISTLRPGCRDGRRAEVARLAEMLHNAGAQGAGDVMHVRRPRGDVRDERGVASIRRSSPSAPGRMTKASPTPKVSAKAQRRPVKSAPGLRPCDNSEVTKFLQQIGLPQYAEALYNSGFEDMETLVDIEEDHMRDLGILPGHQVKLRKRLDEFEAGVPVVQINQRKALGDWEEEDDYPAVPVRIAPSMTLLKGATPSEKQISSVQLSWNHLKEIGTPVVGEYFCKKILEISPEIKDLFPPSVRCRYRDWSTDEEEDERCLASSPALRRLFGRVIDAVGSAVAGMQDMNRMVPALTELGLRHVNYNVKEEHFQVFEKALMITLREGLGDLFTKEVEFAWNMAFNFMSATMISGLRSAQSAARSQQTELSKEPNMSTTATPTETPSSASGSGRGRLRAQDAASTPFGVGTELHGKEPYRIERHLQKAIFGDVFEVLGLESQRRLAVKVTELEKMRLQAKHQALVESPLCEIRFAEMMKGLDNVIQLEDTFGDDDRHYVVMELASGGDLMEALELRHSGFQEEHAKKLILDVARGLASLHMRGLAMQDVSLENMLIFLDDEEQWQVRVGDPGQAVAFVMDPATGQEKVVSFNGLVADDFRPPELYEEKDYLASRVDSWCLGWNTFYLLTAAPLFKTSDPAMQDTDFLLLSQGRISQLFEMKGVSHRLSYDAKDFVTQLMHRDPVKRMPIKDALWHPWLKDCLAQQLRGESTSKLRMPLVPEASSSTEPVFDTAPVPVSTLDSGASSSSANISPALT